VQVIDTVPRSNRYGVATISRLSKFQVSFVKEHYKRDYILQKRPIILRSLLIVATPCTNTPAYTYISICIYIFICTLVYTCRCGFSAMRNVPSVYERVLVRVYVCVYTCVYSGICE